MLINRSIAYILSSVETSLDCIVVINITRDTSLLSFLFYHFLSPPSHILFLTNAHYTLDVEPTLFELHVCEYICVCCTMVTLVALCATELIFTVTPAVSSTVSPFFSILSVQISLV